MSSPKSRAERHDSFILGKLPFNRIVVKKLQVAKLSSQKTVTIIRTPAQRNWLHYYRNSYRARTFIRSARLSQMNFDGKESQTLWFRDSIVLSACQKPDREGGPSLQVPVMNKLVANVLSKANS